MIEAQLTAASAEPPNPGLDALDDGFVMLGRDWRVSYWNPAAARLLSVSREDALGRELWQLLPHLRQGACWRALHDARDQRRAERFPDRLRADQPERVFQLFAAPAADGLALQIRDVSRDMQREQRYLGLLESIRDGFVAVDSEWRISYLNSTAESLLRLPRERAVGAPIWPMLPQHPPSLAQTLRATMDDRIQRHLRSVRPEGRVFRGRVFDLWTAPLPEGGISVLLEDVSERVQTEHELARLAAQAEEANHAKSRFFAAVSHELRTPLNAIIGYTHLLQTETYGPMPEGAARAASRAGVCAEHLARLVEDVLVMTTAEVSRLPVSPVPLRLKPFLDAALQPHRQQAEAKGLRLSLHVAADVPVVETDADRLRQLLGALVSNAVKYTPRGRVSVAAVTVEERATGVGATGEYTLFPEQCLEIRVQDSGPGIAEPDHERVFGAFEQLGDPARSDSMARGAGLGLTLARQLAQLLRGSLSLTSCEGEGACFVLRLPVQFPRVDG